MPYAGTSKAPKRGSHLVRSCLIYCGAVLYSLERDLTWALCKTNSKDFRLFSESHSWLYLAVWSYARERSRLLWSAPISSSDVTQGDYSASQCAVICLWFDYTASARYTVLRTMLIHFKFFQCYAYFSEIPYSSHVNICVVFSVSLTQAEVILFRFSLILDKTCLSAS